MTSTTTTASSSSSDSHLFTMSVDFYNVASTASSSRGHNYGTLGLAFGRRQGAQIDRDFLFAVVTMQSPPRLSWGSVDERGRLRSSDGDSVDLSKRLPGSFDGRLRGKTWYRVRERESR